MTKGMAKIRFRVSKKWRCRRHCCHSLRLNALCVIYVYLIPSGDSDSLRHSYSTACTASGYHFVISAITGETVLL